MAVGGAGAEARGLGLESGWHISKGRWQVLATYWGSFGPGKSEERPGRWRGWDQVGGSIKVSSAGNTMAALRALSGVIEMFHGSLLIGVGVRRLTLVINTNCEDLCLCKYS